MRKIIRIGKEWQVDIIVNSQDCPNKFRKWKPAAEGYFCRETQKRCTRNKCPFQIDVSKNSSFTDIGEKTYYQKK